jgi:hypothetical protein
MLKATLLYGHAVDQDAFGKYYAEDNPFTGRQTAATDSINFTGGSITLMTGIIPD